MGGPGIVEEAGDLGVGSELALGDLREALAEEVGRGAVGSEGDGAKAEFALGEEEDGAIDEIGM